MIAETLGLVRRTGDAHEIVFQRLIARPVEKVWAALTVPERIADWLTLTEIELRVGGAFRLIFPDHDYAVEGRIVELDPPRLIAWTWPDPKHPDSVVRWTLAPDGEGCQLTLVQTGLKPPELPDVAAGWHTHLEGLAGAVDGTKTPWRAAREWEVRAMYAGLAEARAAG